MAKVRKYAIVFQDNLNSKPLYWTGVRYKYRYELYADLTSSPEFVKVFPYMSRAVRALEALRRTTVNKGTYKIIEWEVTGIENK